MKTTRDWEDWQRRMARLPRRTPVPMTDEQLDEDEDRCILNDTDKEGA